MRDFFCCKFIGSDAMHFITAINNEIIVVMRVGALTGGIRGYVA